MSVIGQPLITMNPISVISDFDLFYILDYSEPLNNNYRSVTLSRVKDYVLNGFSPTIYTFNNGLTESLNSVSFTGGLINVNNLDLITTSDLKLSNNFGSLKLESVRVSLNAIDKELESSVIDNLNTNFNLTSYTNLVQSNSYKLQNDNHLIESGSTSLTKTTRFEFNFTNNSFRLFSSNSNYVGLKSNNPVSSYTLSLPTTLSSNNSLMLFDNLGNSTWLNKDYFLTDVFNSSVNKLPNTQIAFGDINSKITSNNTITTNGIDIFSLGNGNNNYTLNVGGLSILNNTNSVTFTKSGITNFSTDLISLSGRLQIGENVSVISANGQLRLNSGNIELFSNSVVGNWINLNSIATPNQRIPYGDTNGRQLTSSADFFYNSTTSTLLVPQLLLNDTTKGITGLTSNFLTMFVGDNRTMQFRAGLNSSIMLEYANQSNGGAILINSTSVNIGTGGSLLNLDKQINFNNGISFIGGDAATWTPQRGALRTDALGTKIEVYLNGVWREIMLV